MGKVTARAAGGVHSGRRADRISNVIVSRNSDCIRWPPEREPFGRDWRHGKRFASPGPMVAGPGIGYTVACFKPHDNPGREMFELQRLQGSREEGIALQTTTGLDIGNFRGVDLTEYDEQMFRLLLNRCGQNWEPRKPPIGTYNCAGHVWASRRTSIADESDWKMILREDGYRKTDKPVPDDLVIYVEKDHGIYHIGRVVELRTGVTGTSSRLPWAVSKWGLPGGEVCHYVRHHPWQGQGFVVAIEYWTDRPAT